MLVTIFGHVGKQRCLNLQHIDNMNVAWMIILYVVVNLCVSIWNVAWMIILDVVFNLCVSIWNVAWMIILDVVVNLCINMERLPAYVICYNNIYMDIALYRFIM